MRNLNRIWIHIGFDALRSAFKPILLAVFCLFLSTPFGAEDSKLIVFDKAAYFQSIKKDPNRVLVDLESIPEVVFDVRYATENNFTGQKIYN
jgi:D-alanyl-D-alanine dipeptidase